MDDKCYKNIYLVGPSRCGKTTTASVLSKEYGYTHIIFDAVIETMSSFAPELQIRHGNLESPEFLNFLSTYSKNLFKYTKHNIIDLETFSPENAKKMLDENEAIPIYMGYPSITPEEKLLQMRKYDTKFDWTRNLPDDELISLLGQHIETSKRLQKDAEKYGYNFIDTSFNREENIRKSIDNLVKSNILDRDKSSLEKYYR